MKLQSALDYARRGFSVFPCKVHGKTPLSELAPNGFKNATKDPAIITDWWTKYPLANIGIATGEPSGIFVLDVDVKNDAGGLESLLELEREFGEIPDSPTALTWSGGMHIFFKHQKGRKSGAGFRPGIDIRGDGGYVIAAPSEVEGGQYLWECDKSLDDLPLVEAPSWVINLKKTSKSNTNPAAGGEIIKSNRNETLMQMGMRMRGLGMDQETILSQLTRVNRTRCYEPLPDEEIAVIAKSVSNYDEYEIKDPLTEFWAIKEFTKSNTDLVYCDKLKGWHYWDGLKWCEDETFTAERKCIHTIEDIYKKSLVSDHKAFKKFAISLQQEQKISKILRAARSIKGMSVGEDHFNQNEDLINMGNGVYDLSSGKLLDHDRKLYLTKVVPVDYDEDATCPNWENFLSDIFSGDRELIGFIQRAIGYSLTTSMAEQCLFILWGTGANGKSTFLRHLSKLFGGYGMNAPANILVEKKFDSGVPNDIARLKDVRFVTCLETKRNKYLDEAQVKSLTGGDIISARFLHREFFDFLPKFKIWFATNHKPQVGGMDTGIWRRLKAIPFNRSFEGEERDQFLDSRIEGEYSGIFNWALRGYSDWRREGLGDCKAVREHTEEYKEESDIIDAFMSDCVDIDGEKRTQATDLMERIKIWRVKVDGRYISRNEMNDYLKMKGFKKYKDTDDGRAWYWYGFGLKYWSGSENLDKNAVSRENIPF